MSLPDPATVPCSPLDETAGMKYFPRMVAKIRLHAEGKLWSDLHNNLGKGADGWCCNYLRINYDDLKTRVMQGGTDEEILAWCQANGHQLNDADRFIWNSFASKLGWNDLVAARLAKLKRDSGFEHRDDIQTMPHFIDVDEGRRE